MTSAAYADLCPGCLTDKGTASICPHCGYDESLKRGPLVLPHRALLHQGQYLIGKVLGKPGGFGITYLALDTRLETKVAIKEYLPRDLAGRDGGHATISAHSAEDGEFFCYGLTQFLQEARTLAKFDHANIVRVRNFFEENGTGYLVMDYYDGITLADYLAQQPQGKLSEKTAVGILMPILDGLREVHAKNFLHRDIKPQNIYLTTGNRPILLDFGAARQAMGERSRSISVVLSEGYAPYEQYHRRGEQGPWTDIYACAAVLYHAVAGEAPPPATERVHKDELDLAALGVSASLAEALRLGLAVDHNKRPQRMTEFQALLLGSGEIGGAVEGEKKFNKVDLPVPAKIGAPRPVEPTQSKSPSGLMMWWAPASAVVIVIVMVAIFANAEKGNVPNANLLSLVSSNLEADPDHENQVTMNALMRNRAPYTQAFPNLQIILTDSQDKAVARRDLRPADYLPPSANEKIGFLPNREFKVKVRLNTADLRPTGYRLVLFYSKQDKEAESTLLPTILLATPEDTSVPVTPVANMQLGKVFKDCPDCPAMVIIPAGSFQMGETGLVRLHGDQGSSGTGPQEEIRSYPVHTVVLAAGFAMGKTEITKKQWRSLMGSIPYDNEEDYCGGDCPVRGVSWDDVQKFILRLNAKTGKSYRLPSEAEWEYACRGGKREKYCGGSNLNTVAWHSGSSDSNSHNHEHAVALMNPNAFGLYDMSGNVFEWVQDCTNNSYIGAPSDGSAWQAGDCDKRIARGGASNFNEEDLNPASRWPFDVYGRPVVGFRLARGMK